MISIRSFGELFPPRGDRAPSLPLDGEGTTPFLSRGMTLSLLPCASLTPPDCRFSEKETESLGGAFPPWLRGNFKACWLLL